MYIILRDKAKSFYLLNRLTSRNSVKDVSLYADQKRSEQGQICIRGPIIPADPLDSIRALE